VASSLHFPLPAPLLNRALSLSFVVHAAANDPTLLANINDAEHVRGWLYALNNVFYDTGGISGFEFGSIVPDYNSSTPSGFPWGIVLGAVLGATVALVAVSIVQQQYQTETPSGVFTLRWRIAGRGPHGFQVLA